MVKNPSVNAGDSGDKSSILGLAGFPGGGNGNPFQYSFLFLILLYNIVLFLPYIDLNPPWVYMCPTS